MVRGVSPALETLLMPFERGEIAIPPRALLLGAEVHPAFKEWPSVTGWQPFKPLAVEWEKSGHPRTDAPGGTWPESATCRACAATCRVCRPRPTGTSSTIRRTSWPCSCRWTRPWRRRWTGWDTSVPFDEILDVSDRAVDLTRLNAGAPALDSHSVWSSHSQVGVVERAWIEGKEGKATIRFPREGLDQAADRMFGLISDGIIRNVSVGYSIERVKVVEPAAKGEVEQRIVERWTPLEVSFVTVPADPRAQVRAADQASFPI